LARRTLTDRGVEALKPRAARYAHPDPEMPGHYVRVTPSGLKSFYASTRDPSGKQVWTKTGDVGVTTVAEAREIARAVIKRVKTGLPAFEQAVTAETFAAVAENWMKRHVEAKGLRTKGEIARILGKYILPAWGDRVFTGIRRSDAVALMDRVEDEHGARQADCALTVISSIMNWYASRRDDYSVPLVRNMKRDDPKKAKRARILNDAELAAVWKAAEGNGAFGAFIRLAILTAQRRETVATTRWEDVVDGAWVIPARDRAKGTGGELVLPKLARDIIEAQPRMTSNPFVFAGRGSHFNHFSQAKREFDAALPEVTGWTIHDLRRTARSLMSRASIAPEIAERLMGHAIEGIQGTYDRHSYKAEKAAALERLAALVEDIVGANPLIQKTNI
jgi:integrase